MKQKIIVKVSINCDKCRTKALKIAAASDGVSSVTIQGADKDELLVTGEGIDAVKLTLSMRKKLRNANIVSLQEDKQEEEREKEERTTRPANAMVQWHWHAPPPGYHYQYYPPFPVYGTICNP